MKCDYATAVCKLRDGKECVEENRQQVKDVDAQSNSLCLHPKFLADIDPPLSKPGRAPPSLATSPSGIFLDQAKLVALSPKVPQRQRMVGSFEVGYGMKERDSERGR